MKIDRYMAATELEACDTGLTFDEPVRIGDNFFQLERYGKLLCVFDLDDTLVEAYAASRQETATHLFSSESREWSVGATYSFGPYRPATQ